MNNEKIEDVSGTFDGAAVTVDTPEFDELLGDYLDASNSLSHGGNVKQYDALIAHIDAHVAQAVARAVNQACRDRDGNHVEDLRAWLDEARDEYERQDVAYHACALKLKKYEDATQTQTSEAAHPKCQACSGKGVVDDGEINHYPNGDPYMNGPIKCVKDCPDCTRPVAAQPGDGELPALPSPSPTHYRERGMLLERMEMFTADQMRDYGRLCLAAREPAPVAAAVAQGNAPSQPANNARGDIVPGKMHCAKCDFSVIRTVLNVATGGVYAGNNKTEPCPNGCGPLWPITWEQEAREGYTLCNQLFERAQAAESALSAAQPVSERDAVGGARGLSMQQVADQINGSGVMSPIEFRRFLNGDGVEMYPHQIAALVNLFSKNSERDAALTDAQRNEIDHAARLLDQLDHRATAAELFGILAAMTAQQGEKGGAL